MITGYCSILHRKYENPCKRVRNRDRNNHYRRVIPVGVKALKPHSDEVVVNTTEKHVHGVIGSHIVQKPLKQRELFLREIM
jgi:hypothetical protein